MKIIPLLLTSLIGSISFGASFNFDADTVGTTPPDWSSGFYGPKGSPIWKVEKDTSAPTPPGVLKQTGHATYSWFVHKDTTIKNGSVSASFKIISGKEDPESGIVWRHKDGKNYYYARANATEENIVFYRMNKGKKEQVKVADTKVSFNTWHTLKAEFRKDQIDIFFDGKSLISIRDAVFTEAGKVGLFTTADTVSEFDNVEVQSF
jgi:hypothetical protein